MTVTLVTGAGGFVGAHLCRKLASLDGEVRRVSSKPGVRSRPELAHVEASEPEIAAALEGAEVVYFLAGIAHEAAAGGDPDLMRRINVEAPRNWLRVADRVGVRRFVWLSSIKVLGDTSASPVRPDDPYRPGDPYARSKVEAEERLLGEALSVTALAVVRPPLVYGPEVRGNFAALLRLAASGVPLPLAGATAPRSLVAVDNLCDLLIRLARDGEGVFHAADGEDLTVAGIVSTVRRQLAMASRLFHVPRPWVRAGCRLTGRGTAYTRLFEPLRMSIEETRERLGWAPPRRVEETLADTVTWLRMSR